MLDESLLQMAAIVCHDVAIDKKPILFAQRSASDDTSDSGWQFLCGADAEDWQTAQVWALREVLNYDPTLSDFLMLPIGTTLRRVSANAIWQIQNQVQ